MSHPLPWRVKRGYEIIADDASFVAEICGSHTTEDEDAVHAALIVRAVNSHAELVAALDEAINYVAAHASLTKSAEAAAFLDKCTAALKSAGAA